MNSVTLLGRLTYSPELKYSNNDIAVTKFTMAINRPPSKDGENQADFIVITAFRETAEFVCNYFEKGQLVAVEGSIRTNKYTDKDGNKRTSFEVLANKVHFAERKRSTQNSNTDFVEIDVTADRDLPF